LSRIRFFGYGAAIILALSLSLQAQTFKALYKFTLKDGQDPTGVLVEDPSGNLYGTTVFGGSTATGGENIGYGTIFRLSTSGQETVLHNFTGKADGRNPYAGLTADGQGNFYGAAYFGGIASCPQADGGGCGTAYKLDSTGRFTVGYSFKGPFHNPPDGYGPYESLYRNSAGRLFGTTLMGGNTFAFESDGCGVVYELNSKDQENVLYSFDCTTDPTADGWHPESSLVEDANGNLYGTTAWGGLTNCNSPFENTGCGTVFELSHGSSGWTETVLYRFRGESDGSFPEAGLVMDSDGNLYGTTFWGGDLSCTTYPYGCGTVFKLSPSGKTWKETVLYAFTGGASGAGPESQLVRDSAGNFYGTAVNGGDVKCPYGTNGFSGCGVVFGVTPAGRETVLHAFHGTDGFTPVAGLLLDSSTKTLYGTTTYGGDIAHCSYPQYYYGCGVVYSVGIK
jgi:uncharacterized repeat protein (TIGR03803 family)